MCSQRAYNALMHEVCVERGWCGGIVDGAPSHVCDFIPEAGSVTTEQFVAWLFPAEGVNPSFDPDICGKHKDGLRAAFVRHMGGDVVDAPALKWHIG